MKRDEKFILFIIVSLFLISFVSSDLEIGFDDTAFPRVQMESEINYTEIITYVNNTIYWNGHAWSDTRWLEIDGGNANTNIDIGIYNFTTTGGGFFGYLGSLVNRITNIFATNINFNGTITGDGSGLTNIETDIWTKDLVLDMPFQAGSPNKDYSAYENHGTVVGDMFWNSTGGYNGFGAYEFDNSDDYISVDDDDSLDLDDYFTYSAWIYPKATADDYIVIKKSAYYFAIKSTQKLAVDTYTGMGWGVEVQSTTSYNLNEWNHVVAVMGLDGDVTFYLNGVLAGTGSTGSSATLSNQIMTIGGFDGGSSLFNGTIDELMIWDRALTENEVLNIYNLRRKEPHFSGDLNVTGNVTANYFFGSGAELEDLNVSGILNVTGDFTGYAINISYLYGATGIGGMDLRGDPWWLGGVSLELTENLIVGGNITASYFNGINISNFSNVYVPYTGATSNLDLGNYNISADWGFLNNLNITQSIHMGANDFLFFGDTDDSIFYQSTENNFHFAGTGVTYLTTTEGLFNFSNDNIYTEGNITASWFKGIFNWIIGSSSTSYLSFNGTQLNFNESFLNNTIESISESIGAGLWEDEGTIINSTGHNIRTENITYGAILNSSMNKIYVENTEEDFIIWI